MIWTIIPAIVVDNLAQMDCGNGMELMDLSDEKDAIVQEVYSQQLSGMLVMPEKTIP